MSKMHRSVYAPLCDNPHVFSLLPLHQEHVFLHRISTPGRRQSKTIDDADQKSPETVFLLPFVASQATNGNRKLCFKRFFIQVRR